MHRCKPFVLVWVVSRTFQGLSYFGIPLILEDQYQYPRTITCYTYMSLLCTLTGIPSLGFAAANKI
jgi:hypothetical protein